MHRIEVNGMVVDIVRKDIKNLHLAVYPPEGRVRVAAPLLLNDEAVRLAVIERLPWIRRQQQKYLEQDRQPRREYVSGESHYFQGRRYLLNVIEREGAAQVSIRNKKTIDLFVRPGSTLLQRERVMQAWYRSHLRSVVPPMIEKWEKVIGVEVASLGIKEMKTKWGTCNIEARRVWVNLELAKKSERCLEFIVVHEMVHLLERHHNERYLELMNRFLPSWRQYREELNRAPLAHAEWEY
ncbi:MAG: M48 family metallopeptidase [Anaerolineales bacterium]|nr:M48 family metallopeptidase [Anaerolineales bacterium]